LRCIVPILTKDGELLGSLEVWLTPIDRMMEDFTQTFKQADRYVIVFNKEFEKIFDKNFIEEGKSRSFLKVLSMVSPKT